MTASGEFVPLQIRSAVHRQPSSAPALDCRDRSTGIGLITASQVSGDDAPGTDGGRLRRRRQLCVKGGSFPRFCRCLLQVRGPDELRYGKLGHGRPLEPVGDPEMSRTFGDDAA
jgi:hypothetical protein